MPNITHTHFRDMDGRLIWVEPLQHEIRLYQVGDRVIPPAHVATDPADIVSKELRVQMVAIADHVQVVNVAKIAEAVNIVEPYL